MRVYIYILFFLSAIISKAEDTLFLADIDSSLVTEKLPLSIKKDVSIYDARLRNLDAKSPMDLRCNEKVQFFINNYLGRDKNLISKMQGLKDLYFPLFEQQLDKYELPLELKYLAIVESALNPKARSSSGAVGLWQFMYLTGKQYGLKVTSYMDERQDPYKATEAACMYFLKLKEMFGDWNLVLAAYNGGPGYLQKKINLVGSYDFWELYPYLRKETRNYIPKFIAINYIMNYSNDHAIVSFSPEIITKNLDTLSFKKQVELKTLIEILCVNKETINYLNPAYKKEIYPKGSILTLPSFAVNDFLNNEEMNYKFIEGVAKKEILIDEDRIVYTVKKGDYLGRIARDYGVYIYEIKEWNNLRSTDLDVGDRLVLYVKINQEKEQENSDTLKNEYIIQKGDTLWEIARRYKGLSVWKIKALNNLESDYLKPGTKIILPVS